MTSNMGHIPRKIKLNEHQPNHRQENPQLIKGRRENTVLIRVRILHKRLTTVFLLRAEDVPRCILCNYRLTHKYILFERKRYQLTIS